jgi:hypothetical protein
MFGSNSSSSDFLETDSAKQRRKNLRKQKELDRIQELRSKIPKFEIA